VSEILLRIELPHALTAALVRLCDRLGAGAGVPVPPAAPAPDTPARLPGGQPLRDPSIERIKVLAAAGKSSREIVAETGASKGAVLKYMAGVDLLPGAAPKPRGRPTGGPIEGVRAALAQGTHTRAEIAAAFNVHRKFVDNVAYRTRRKIGGPQAPAPAAPGRVPAQAVAGGVPAGLDVSSQQTAPAPAPAAGAFLEGATVPVTRERARAWAQANGVPPSQQDSVRAINARRERLGKPPFVVVPSNGTLTRPL